MNRKLTNESLAFLTAVALLFASCKKGDNITSPANDGKVRFSSSISGQPGTRVTGNAWDANDNIGIYMNAANGGTALAENKKYTTSGNGNFTAEGAELISYPTDGSSVNFIAYYPYQASLSGNTYKIDLTNQSSASSIDLMYANNATNFNKNSTNTPNLEFNHQLTKIELTVKAGTGVTSIDGVTVSFDAMNTKADFSLSNGTLSAAGTPANIQAKVAAAGTDKLASAILLPVDDASNKTVTFSLPSGESYTWTLPNGTKFEKGKKYNYNIVLQNSAPPKAVVIGNANISDWLDVPAAGDINIDKNGASGNGDPSTPGESTPQQIFKETFGSTPVTANTLTADFTGYDNTAPIVFSDAPAKSTGIRLGTSATAPFDVTWNGQNLLYLPLPSEKAPTPTFKVAHINTKGYSNIKLSLDVATGNLGTAYSLVKIKYNGITYDLDKTNRSSTDRNPVTFEVDLGTATASDEGALDIYLDGSSTSIMRIDNVTLKGVKQ